MLNDFAYMCYEQNRNRFIDIGNKLLATREREGLGTDKKISEGDAEVHTSIIK